MSFQTRARLNELSHHVCSSCQCIMSVNQWTDIMWDHHGSELTSCEFIMWVQHHSSSNASSSKRASATPGMHLMHASATPDMHLMHARTCHTYIHTHTHTWHTSLYQTSNFLLVANTLSNNGLDLMFEATKHVLMGVVIFLGAESIPNLNWQIVTVRPNHKKVYVEDNKQICIHTVWKCWAVSTVPKSMHACPSSTSLWVQSICTRLGIPCCSCLYAFNSKFSVEYAMLTRFCEESIWGVPQTYTVWIPNSFFFSKTSREWFAAQWATPPKVLRKSDGTLRFFCFFFSFWSAHTSCARSSFEIPPCSARTLAITRAGARPCFEGEVAATFNNFGAPRFLLLIRWSVCARRLRSSIHFPSTSTVTRTWALQEEFACPRKAQR